MFIQLYSLQEKHVGGKALVMCKIKAGHVHHNGNWCDSSEVTFWLNGGKALLEARASTVF